jgi:hypothetical protein
MERRQDDRCVGIVRGSLREGSALVPLHEGEEPDQPLIGVHRDPDREVEAIRDVQVSIIVDVGRQKGTMEQLEQCCVETSSSFMTSITLISYPSWHQRLPAVSRRRPRPNAPGTFL